MKGNAVTDLVSSLSRAEKRYVQLFIKRNKPDSNLLKLYTLLSGPGNKKKIKDIPNHAVLSSYLYDQIMSALVLLHKDSSIDSRIRVRMNEAEILFHRSLYHQALDRCDDAMELAREHERHSLEQDIIDLQRRIRQRIDKLDMPHGSLLKEWNREKELLELNRTRSAYRYYAYEIFQLGRKEAVVRDKQKLERYSEILNDPLFTEEKNATTFQTKIDLYGSKAIYYRAVGDFDKLYEARKKNLEVLDAYPEQVNENPGIYLTSVNNLIIACFHKGLYDEGYAYIQKMKAFKTRNADQKMRMFVNINSLELGYFDYTKNYKLGIVAAKEVEEGLIYYNTKLSVHNKVALWFNIAIIYFKAGELKSSSRCLSHVINERSEYRVEVFSLSRILQLLIFLELKEPELLESLLKSSERFLDKTERLFEFEQMFLKWIKSVMSTCLIGPNELNELEKSIMDLRADGKFRETDDLIGLEDWIRRKKMK